MTRTLQSLLLTVLVVLAQAAPSAESEEERKNFGHVKALTSQVAAYWKQADLDQAARCSLEAIHILKTTSLDELGLPPQQGESIRLSSILTMQEGLGEIYRKMGRYADAEQQLTKALESQGKLPPNGVHRARLLLNLGEIARSQAGYEEADKRFLEAWRILNKPPESKDKSFVLANCVASYALLQYDQWVLDQETVTFADEAEKYYEMAENLFENAGFSDHPNLADCLNNLGRLHHERGRYGDPAVKAERFQDAEDNYGQALRIIENATRIDPASLADSLHSQALLFFHRQDFDAAEKRLERAGGIIRNDATMPLEYALKVNYLKARVAWQNGRRDTAIGHLKQAMDEAIRQRARGSGGGFDRARFFTQLTNPFERMVEWQVELGDVSEALDAIEGSRARSLSDQMQVAQKDLLAELPEQEARRLDFRLQEAEAQVLQLEKQWIALRSLPSGRITQAQQEQIEEIKRQLIPAHQTHAAAYDDLCNASPAYRRTIERSLETVPLTDLQPRVKEQGALFLEYLFGVEGGYVLIIPAGGKPRLEKLVVNESQARVLNVEPGPLTAERLEMTLIKSDGTGIVQRVRAAPSIDSGLDPERKGEQQEQAAKELLPDLAALWELLIPEAEREAILAGSFNRMIVVPDASLAWLPFETLVVARGEKPQYLVQMELPIEYAPSATILRNLVDKPATNSRGVLTVGGVDYSAVPEFGPLNKTKAESIWVKEIFADKWGLKVTQRLGPEATEPTIRQDMPGEKILHFACHGIADQEFGNLVGWLAFAPGKAGGLGDDGSLTLTELRDLDLRGCELAILSACQTNFGPQQRGEGVWALSRGFLVAGARRVVATNWSVSDESASTLVSYFCHSLWEQKEQGEKLDYARALHLAKKAIREQSEWKHPHHWGAFVLVGPN